MKEDLEFLLDVALDHSNDQEVNFHIRTALQHIQIERDFEEIEND